MAGKTLSSKALSAMALMCATTAHAAPVYVALFDSSTFGETDLSYVQSFGDRGYVSLFANTLAARNGSVSPAVFNVAIDGETASSFMANAGRTPPVVGRGDAPLQLENLNYVNSTAISQGTLFANTVAAQRALGNTVGAVTVTLGFNELAALSPMQNTPAAEAAAVAQIPGTLAAYRASYTAVLNEIRSLVPTANLYLLGYFNPFPADPNNPAAPVFNAGGTALNGVIQDLAGQFGAAYVANAAPFVGNEARYTFQAAQPAGSSVAGPFSGVLPIGNVHPNALGYSVIAADVAAATMPASVPELGSWPVLVAGLAALGLAAQRRRARAQ